MVESVSDHGTVLTKEEWAIIWSQAQGWKLLAPEMRPGDVVPRDGLALMALYMRFSGDEAFRRECEDWFHQQQKMMG